MPRTYICIHVALANKLRLLMIICSGNALIEGHFLFKLLFGVAAHDTGLSQNQVLGLSINLCLITNTLTTFINMLIIMKTLMSYSAHFFNNF